MKRHEEGLKTRQAPNVIILRPNTTWTDSILTSELCTPIQNPLVTSVVISSAGAGIEMPTFNLPACFWIVSDRINSFSSSIPLRINGTSVPGESDPLLRFSTTLTTLSLVNVSFVDEVTGNGADGYFLPDWSSFFAARPGMASLSIYNSKLVGSVPPVLPANLRYIHLGYNNLNGSIPNAWIQSTTSSIEINMNGNRLSGSVPATLWGSGPSSVSSLNLQLAFNDLSGTIPNAWLLSLAPLSSLTVRLDGNRFSGVLPSLYFSAPQFTQFSLQLQDNKFTGSVQGGWSGVLQASEIMSMLTIDVSRNQLTGTIPALFWAGSTRAPPQFTFSLAGNRISGSIPVLGFQPSNSLTPTAMTWNLADNNISGSIPFAFLGYSTSLLSSVSSVSVDLSGNNLTGTLPSTIYTYAGREGNVQVSLSFARNRLSGPLSSYRPSSRARVNDITLDISDNNIGGSIPSDMFDGAYSGAGVSIHFSCDRCGLSGTIPDALIKSNNEVSLSFNGNQLNGSYPWQEVVMNNSANGIQSYSFSAADNQLTGAVTLPSNVLDGTSLLYLNLAGNSLSSLDIASSGTQYLSLLNVGNNPQLTGTIPTNLFAASSGLTSFTASNTLLHGSFPLVSGNGPSFLNTLVLSDTNIEFCQDGRTAWTSSTIVVCKLDSTASNCSELYPSKCNHENDPPSPVQVPSATPPPPPTAAPTEAPVNPSAPSSPSEPDQPETPSFNPEEPEAPTAPSIAPTAPPVPSAPSTPSSGPNVPNSAARSLMSGFLVFAVFCSLLVTLL